MRYIGWVLVVVGEAKLTQCNPCLGMRTRRPGTRCQKAGSGQPPNENPEITECCTTMATYQLDLHFPLVCVCNFFRRLPSGATMNVKDNNFEASKQQMIDPEVVRGWATSSLSAE